MDDVQLLYVEDSKASQRLFEAAMSPIAQCHMASCLAEARQLLGSQRINFVVVDFSLPDGDGLQLVTELRADPRYAKVPIMLFTAMLDQDLAFRAMKAGVNESLSKPMNMLDLRERIVDLIATPTTVKRVRRQLVEMTCSHWVADGKHHAFSPDFNHLISGESSQEVRQEMHDFLEDKLQAMDNADQYPLDVHAFKCIVELDVKEAGEAA